MDRTIQDRKHEICLHDNHDTFAIRAQSTMRAKNAHHHHQHINICKHQIMQTFTHEHHEHDKLLHLGGTRKISPAHLQLWISIDIALIAMYGIGYRGSFQFTTRGNADERNTRHEAFIHFTRCTNYVHEHNSMKKCIRCYTIDTITM